MDILANIITEAVFGIFKAVKPHKTIDGDTMTKEQIAAVTKCIVTLAALAVAAVLAIQLDFVKLALLCFAGYFYMLIHNAFKD